MNLEYLEIHPSSEPKRTYTWELAMQPSLFISGVLRDWEPRCLRGSAFDFSRIQRQIPKHPCFSFVSRFV